MRASVRVDPVARADLRLWSLGGRKKEEVSELGVKTVHLKFGKRSNHLTQML